MTPLPSSRQYPAEQGGTEEPIAGPTSPPGNWGDTEPLGASPGHIAMRCDGSCAVFGQSQDS